MLQAFFAVVLSLPLAGQTQDPKPTAEAIKAAVAAVDEAFTKGKSPERVAAIKSAADVVDAQVAAAIAKGLRDKDREVQVAAVEALRFMPVPAALEELSNFWTRNRDALKKDADLAAKVLQAIGQFGSPKSVALLGDNPFDIKSYPAVQARLMALGNIRTKESLDTVFSLLRRVGEWKADDYMDDVRLVLYRLTGIDNGKDANAWLTWYSNNKNTITVPAEPPQMPKLEQYMWDRYWAKDPSKVPETGGDKQG